MVSPRHETENSTWLDEPSRTKLFHVQGNSLNISRIWAGPVHHDHLEQLTGSSRKTRTRLELVCSDLLLVSHLSSWQSAIVSKPPRCFLLFYFPSLCGWLMCSELQVMMWRACVAKRHMGEHKSEELEMFQCHSSSSHAGRLWLAAARRRRPWAALNRHRQPYFSVFYLNGVKHLQKWEASQYIDKKQKKIFSNFSCKEKKKHDLIFSFCSFCEICSRTEVRHEASLRHALPTHLPKPRTKAVNHTWTPLTSPHLLPAALFFFQRCFTVYQNVARIFGVLSFLSENMKKKKKRVRSSKPAAPGRAELGRAGPRFLNLDLRLLSFNSLWFTQFRMDRQSHGDVHTDRNDKTGDVRRPSLRSASDFVVKLRFPPKRSE